MRHDVRHAERTADFDQFAARCRHLFAKRKRIQHQHHGGGVVVDDGCSFRARHFAKLRFDMFVPVAAFSLPYPVFQIAGAPSSLRHRVDGFLGQGGKLFANFAGRHHIPTICKWIL